MSRLQQLLEAVRTVCAEHENTQPDGAPCPCILCEALARFDDGR